MRDHPRPPRDAQLTLWFALAGLAAAGGSSGAHPRLETGGSVQANLHLGFLECGGSPADCPWLDFQDLLVVRGRMRGAPNDAVAYVAEGALRLHPGTGVDALADASYADRVQPYSLEIPQAWVELREGPIDVRLGQQRFAWGVSDGIHAVDVVNPYDLADPTRFDARLGIPAVSSRLLHKQATLELVYVPLFRPARMPAGLDVLAHADELFDLSGVGGGELNIGELETRTTVPDTRAGFASFAARASVMAPFADLAVVAYHGRDTLPQVGGEALLVGFATAHQRVDVGIPVVFPKMTLLGAEARGPLLWDVAGWIEAAVVIPERLTVTASRAQLQGLADLGLIDEIPDPLPEAVIQDGRAYGRWVVGLERFVGRFALNAQWVHGLPTERSAGEVGDYAVLATEVTASDNVRLRVHTVTDGAGILAAGTVSVLHGDHATWHAGVTFVEAPGGTALGALRPMSNATVGVDVSF